MAGRAKRRGNYNVNKTELRKASMSRREARDMACNAVTRPCDRCEKIRTLGQMDVHHVDGNPHNNPVDGTNHSWLCEPCHHEAQSELTRAEPGWIYRNGRYFRNLSKVDSKWVLIGQGYREL